MIATCRKIYNVVNSSKFDKKYNSLKELKKYIGKFAQDFQ